jgi:potassium efflux system protein
MNRILFFCFLIFISTVTFGATPLPQVETITSEFIQSKIDALNTRQGLDDATKNAVLKQYQAAQDNLNLNKQAIAQIAIFNTALHQAPTQTKALQKDIEQITAKLGKPKTEDFHQIPIDELEQRLIIEKEKVSQLDAQIKKLEADLVLQKNRPVLIHEETIVTLQTIDDTRKKLELPAAPTTSKIEQEAQQLYFKTVIETHTTELKRLEAEALSQPARLELLKSTQQLLDMQKNVLMPIVATIENVVFELRSQEAKKMEETLSQTEKDIEGKHALIQKITRENIQYSRDLQAITAKIERIAEQKTHVENQTTDIEEDFKSADKKISLASLSPALGKILREQRRSLASQNEVAAELRELESETALTSLAQFKVEDRQKLLLNLDDTLKQMMVSEVEPMLPFEQRMMIQAELRVLLNSQKELLNKLAVADTTYLRTLGDLDFSRQQMLTESLKFASYLDERLLWVTSSEPLNTQTLTDFFHSLQWLFSPTNSFKLLSEITEIFWQNLFLVIAALGFLVLLNHLKEATKPPIKINESELHRWHTDHFYFTLQALLYPILCVAPIPVAEYFLGSFLTHNSSIDFNFAIGAGLQKVAISLFIIAFCISFFAPEGVARRHFQWQKSNVVLLHSQFLWLRFVVLPATFLIQATNASKFSEYSDSLGRFSLIVMLIALMIFMAKLFHPKQGLNPEKWHGFLRYITYALVIVVPCIIIGFAVTGYYLSALELQEKLISTLRVLMIAVIVHEILLRWITLANRQLALKNNVLNNKHTPISDEDLLFDIPKINAQTRKLLHVTLTLVVFLSCWLIWKNILPAFSFLDHIVLWQHKTIVDNQDSYQPITLTNLFIAVFYLFVAVVTVRNFYGVLELFVFQRWEIETGSRYAINQLSKYVFITAAFICIANELGGSWSQVQFLVAALGVGLGFGLQEIFANLVSGIILLFERPIRVGDIVTIGDVTGTVSRIQMRATTLIDNDQKELIVPNKTFITSQLTNWTLSDATTRIVLPIGIAFGSDVEFAHELMLKTVKETPLILQNPEAFVVFVGFGDSTLNFSIRAFVSEPIHRWAVIHDLNMRLERTLRENKIEIPFPQREVHVRS